MNIVTRLITGLALFSILVFSIVKSTLLFSIVMFLVSAFILFEINSIKSDSRSFIINSISLGLFTGLFWTLYFFKQSMDINFIVYSAYFIIPVSLFYLLSFLEFFLKESVFKTYKLLSHIHSFLLVFLSLPFIALLRFESYGLVLCLYSLIIISSTDSVALFAGKRFGKHSISAISPKKTWEGSIFGTGSTVLISYAFASFNDQYHLAALILFGIIISIIGQFGDFYASRIKRTFSVKDSSSLLPGHGGFLDRCDSYLFASIFIFYFHGYFL